MENMQQIKCYCGHTDYCDCGPLLEEPKQETLEEVAKRIYGSEPSKDIEYYAFIAGAKWQAERMYSEEDMIEFAHFYFKEEFNSTMQTSKSTDEILQEWKQFKKK